MVITNGAKRSASGTTTWIGAREGAARLGAASPATPSPASRATRRTREENTTTNITCPSPWYDCASVASAITRSGRLGAEHVCVTSRVVTPGNDCTGVGAGAVGRHSDVV